LKGFSAEQLQSVALILLKVNDQGAGAALAFFGFSLFWAAIWFSAQRFCRAGWVLSFVAA